MPLVVGGRVFVGDATGTVLAVQADTGKIAWTAQPAGSGVRGGLTGDGKRVYAAFLEGKVVCLASDGRTVWSARVFDQDQEIPGS